MTTPMATPLGRTVLKQVPMGLGCKLLTRHNYTQICWCPMFAWTDVVFPHYTATSILWIICAVVSILCLVFSLHSTSQIGKWAGGIPIQHSHHCWHKGVADIVGISDKYVYCIGV